MFRKFPIHIFIFLLKYIVNNEKILLAFITTITQKKKKTYLINNKVRFFFPFIASLSFSFFLLLCISFSTGERKVYSTSLNLFPRQEKKPSSFSLEFFIISTWCFKNHLILMRSFKTTILVFTFYKYLLK